jgi:outer membrane lipoprotein-sorting protein
VMKRSWLQHWGPGRAEDMYCKRAIAIVCLVITVLSMSRLSRASGDPAARETVDRIARLLVAQSSIATLTMQISNDDGKHDLSMKVWSAGGTDVLIRIIAPLAEANTAVLKMGNDIWYYLPKTNRTVKVPPAMTMNSWMGSDFSIDDLVGESFLTRDYSVVDSFRGDRNGVAVDEYTLTPTPEAIVVWGRIVLQVRQDNRMPAWQGYYDEDGKLVKELTFSDYRNMGGRLIPTRLLMHPTKKAGEQTIIVYNDIVFDAPISEGTFAVNNLASTARDE